MSPSADHPAPNSGGTVPASVALRETEIVQPSRWEPLTPVEKVRIVRLSHMRYRHPAEKIEEQIQFLKDFGMELVKQTDDKIWFGGYGIDQYVYYTEIGNEGEEKKFLGGTWEVESRDDLERAAKLGNTEIFELTDAPGGGSMVTVIDPEGYPVNFIHGATPRPEPTKKPAEPLQVNDEFSKPRRGAFQRFQPGPAAIHKLGHYGCTVHNFERQFRWYTTHFNLVPSDLIYILDEQGNKIDITSFIHIDRGQAYTDHHSFFISLAKNQHVHHSSYEVHDYDNQNMGHHWLKQKGYKPVWGVGRHRLGSQIFDYWWDPNGFMVEHYIDGDLVNEDTPTARHPAGEDSLAVWSDPVPGTFLD
ncbi:hypothetical protein ABW19_dt0209039 [Dactylella cylindrospora]|nr:hypothetical protein ABW19_dt0209039 [Dactylella cylindrospora]